MPWPNQQFGHATIAKWGVGCKLIRRSSTRDDTGKISIEESEENIVAVVQPVDRTTQEIERLIEEEGVRWHSALRFYTVALPILASENSPGDEIEYNGDRYICHSMKSWSTYRKIIGIRKSWASIKP